MGLINTKVVLSSIPGMVALKNNSIAPRCCFPTAYALWHVEQRENGNTSMQLTPIKLADRLVRVNYLSAREIRGWENRVPQSLLRYEAACASDIWRERCVALIADRVVEIESRLQAAPLEDRHALLDAARTSRKALSTLSRELARSRGRAQRLSALPAPGSVPPHLKLVASN